AKERKINGKTITEISKEKKCSYSTIQKILQFSKNEDLALSYIKRKTPIERTIENLLKVNNIKYIHDKLLADSKSKFRPDFLIPSCNLIVECDGLYWHSDKFKDRKYHKNKIEEYRNLGYKSLFFREDEILTRPKIVESIILNKLGKSKRIFARTCKITTINGLFFEQNHLMGTG